MKSDLTGFGVEDAASRVEAEPSPWPRWLAGLALAGTLALLAWGMR